MSNVTSTGPQISAGPMLGYGANAPDPQLKAGPGITYQGDSIPDPRIPMLGANLHVGSIPAHFDHSYFLNVDAVPAASAATPVNIAAAQNVVNGTAMTLAGSSAGITPAVPFKNFATGQMVVAGVTLDMGFTTCVTTAGSPIITPASGTIQYFYPSQWLILGNAGAGGIVPFFARVQSVGTSTVTLFGTGPLASQAMAPVGQGHILSPLSNAPATMWVPNVAAGVAGLYNPLDMIARGWGVACSAAGGGGTFTLRGYDIYGQAMSETLTHPGGGVTVYGRKTFKHIVSVTPGFTDASRTYSIGTSDLFGLSARSDRWEYCNFYVSGTFLSTSQGWTAADQTMPATASTGDVRGTLQVGSRGPLGSGAPGGPMTGTQRIALFMTMPVYNLTQASPANPAPLYGSTQA